MRLGLVTAPIPLWQKLVYHQQVTSMHASSLSQVDTHGGDDHALARFNRVGRGVETAREMGHAGLRRTHRTVRADQAMLSITPLDFVVSLNSTKIEKH